MHAEVSWHHPCQIPATHYQALRHADDTGDLDGSSKETDSRERNRQIVISALIWPGVAGFTRKQGTPGRESADTVR
jgi:hypothetical protein